MTNAAALAAIPSVLQSATGAIQKAARSVSQDAAVVANPDATGSRALLEALVDSRQQLLYTKAAAKMIGASDEMMSTLLDVRA